MKFKNVVFFLFCAILFIMSCDKDEKGLEDFEAGTSVLETLPGIDTSDPDDLSSKSTAQTSKASCGGTFSGSYRTINRYYRYSNKTINVSCARQGSTISLTLNSVDIPNRFTIRDPSGRLIRSSGWMGYANYPGPWGSSLSRSGTQRITFTKVHSSYTLQVETQTPPNYSYSPNGDFWRVTATCTCASTTPDPDDPTPGPGCNVDDCGDYYSGSYRTINRYYRYPDKSMNVRCVRNGRTITVNVSALDIPNRFTIRDSRGTIVANSNWIGYANYPGPWGSSLNRTSNVALRFRKSSNTTVYKLQVETQTPPNYNYYPNGDGWRATLGCDK